MNSIELRLGNWVDYKGKYYQIYDGIKSLSIDDLDNESLDSHLKNIKIKDLKGILLTEEIFSECGFSSYGDNGHECSFYLGKLVVCSDISGFIEDKYGIKITYIHELQNLYFTLTGKELKVKL